MPNRRAWLHSKGDSTRQSVKSPKAEKPEFRAWQMAGSGSWRFCESARLTDEEASERTSLKDQGRTRLGNEAPEDESGGGSPEAGDPKKEAIGPL